MKEVYKMRSKLFRFDSNICKGLPYWLEKVLWGGAPQPLLLSGTPGRAVSGQHTGAKRRGTQARKASPVKARFLNPRTIQFGLVNYLLGGLLCGS